MDDFGQDVPQVVTGIGVHTSGRLVLKIIYIHNIADGICSANSVAHKTAGLGYIEIYIT